MVLFIFDYHWFDVSWYEAFGYSILEVMGYMLIFYLNFWKLQQQDEKWWATIGCSLLIMSIYIAFIRFSGLEYYFYEAADMRNLFSLILNASLFTGLAYLFNNRERSFQMEQQNLQLAATNKQLQIDSLKARINPHFLFNTLNNLNALIVKKEAHIPAYLSKLSGVLRYSMDSGNQKFLPLTKEVQYLQDYLALIKMQEPASANIDMYVEGISEDLHILPFILMTLLENAVKHGDLMYNPKGYIHLTIAVDEVFVFELSNSVAPQNSKAKGIGLDNIKKQLDLIYVKDYTLTTKQNTDAYHTELTISLDKLQLPTLSINK